MTDIVERLWNYLPIDSDPILVEAAVEIERLRAASEWRDMSTAPRDGTPLLVGFPDNFHPLVGHCEGGLWGQLNSDFGFDIFPNPPTHWMPLPAPPQRNEVKK